VDIHEYISSGIIEKYVMGLASPQEREEFERLQSHFPELARARIIFESYLEEKAQEQAIEPPLQLKEKILQAFREESDTVEINTIVGRGKKKEFRKGPGIYWAIAACVILLAGCIGLIWFFYKKNAQLKSEMAITEMKKVSLAKRADQFDQQLEKANLVKEAQVQIFEKGMNATMRVFWDTTSHDVYMVVYDLPLLPPTQQYQIWAIQGKQVKSLGLFDATGQDKLILKLNEAQKADSFAITIERRP
jgi:anti-sigma-K factor RskA